MKIEITANQSTLIAAMNATADTVNEFKPGQVDHSTRDNIENKLRTPSRLHEGPAFAWEYTTDNESENHTGTMTMKIEDDAIVMALPMLLKIAKVVSPIVEMGITTYKMMRNLKDQFDSIGTNFTSEFNKKFGREKTYAVTSIWNDDLQLADMVVVENDGFNNYHLIRAEHCWTVYDPDTIMKVFWATVRRGESTRGNMAMRYSTVEFQAITREAAVEMAEKMRPNLQADVDGMNLKNHNDGKVVESQFVD